MSHTNDVKDMYPDPRKVIFGNGGVANLRCGTKWIAWIGSYAIYASLILGGQFTKYVIHGFVVPFGVVLYDRVLEPAGTSLARFLERYGIGAWFVHQLDRLDAWILRRAHQVKLAIIVFADGVADSMYQMGKAIMSSRVTVVGLIIAAPIAIILMIGDEIDQRTGFFTAIASIIVFVLDSAVELAIGGGKQVSSCSTSGAKRFAGGVKKKAKEAQERPGTRRIYGKCPVTFEQHPKWFDNLFGDDDDDE